jgi:hypothetical protein
MSKRGASTDRARHGLSLMSWSRAFHVPITLPDGRMLRTLRDAGEYIQELPKAEHQRPEWQIAAEMLLEAVEGEGPLMFAEIAMRKAVNAGKPAPEPTPRRRGHRTPRLGRCAVEVLTGQVDLAHRARQTAKRTRLA